MSNRAATNTFFQVGDLVELREDARIGQFYLSEDTKYNPIETDGEIISINNKKDSTIPYIVRWNSGLTNSYEKNNLRRL